MTRQTIDIDPSQVRRILVCQLRQIGDVLLSTPAIRMLRQQFPQAEIHLMTDKSALPVVQGNPDITKIWSVDRKAHRNLAAQLGFYFRVARNRFDLVVDFQQLPRIRWVVGLSRFFKPRGRKQVRLTYTPPWYNRWMYTHWTDTKDGYAAMSKASVLEPLGISWDKPPLTMHLEKSELAQADALLQEYGVGKNDILITVDPTHRRETRRWPARHFAKAIALATKADERLKFLLLFGPGEEDVVKEIAETAGTPNCILTREMLSIREMAAVINRARLHFGNCSAPRHIATAVGTPTLIVLGSTSDAWTYPSEEHQAISLGLECQPCNDNTCPDIRCLRDFTPEAVVAHLMRRVEQYCGDKPCA